MRRINLVSLLLISMFATSAYSQQYPVYYSNYLAPTAPNATIYQQQANQTKNASVSPYQNPYYNPNMAAGQQYYQGNRNLQVKEVKSKSVVEEDYKISGKNGWQLGFSIGRKFTDFIFELTPVLGEPQGSILEWDDMIFNEYNFNVSKTFKVYDMPLFIYGEYKFANLAKSGSSSDDDLRVAPYYWISVGGIEADTNGWKMGIGWDKWFTWVGFQFSPIVGYTHQQQNLTMTDQKYPYPQDVNLYLVDGTGQQQTVWELDGDGNPIPACVLNSMVDPTASGRTFYFDFDGDGTLESFTNLSGHSGYAWDVNYDPDSYDQSGNPVDGCVYGGDIGWDLSGPTQVYDVTWQGMFIGMMVDRYMSAKDSIHFYFEYSLLDYKGQATWPYRVDLQQPGFIDEGNGQGIVLNMAYRHKITKTVDLEVKIEYENYSLDKADTTIYLNPTYFTNTVEHINNAMKSSVWNSMGLYLGLKAVF